MSEQWEKYLKSLSKDQQKKINGIINRILHNQWDMLDIIPMEGIANYRRCRVGSLRIVFRKDAQGVIRISTS